MSDKKNNILNFLTNTSNDTLLPAIHKIKKFFSLEYDDSPLSDSVYNWHRHWLKLVNNYYFRVEHFGNTDLVKQQAKKEHVLVISHHGNTLEAALISYFFMIHQLGKLRMLVYKEAFRLPIVREFFRSGQCVPISVEAGAEALQEGHIMLFPEGMDFIKRYVQKNYVIKFHKGFLNIAKKYMEDNKLKQMHIVPVGHDGIEDSVKFWIINNPTIVEKIIKPVFHYPYFVLPKAPFILPHKTIFKWGKPKKVTLEELSDPAGFLQHLHDFRTDILSLKRQAEKLNSLRGVENLAEA